MNTDSKRIGTLIKRMAVGLVAMCLSFGALAADLKEIQASGVLRHLGIKYANFVKADGTGFDVELAQGFARHIGVRIVAQSEVAAVHVHAAQGVAMAVLGMGIKVGV